MAKQRTPRTPKSAPQAELTPTPEVAVLEPTTPTLAAEVAPAPKVDQGGFRRFRQRHQGRWSESAQRWVQDNEDDVAFRLEQEYAAQPEATRSWYRCPLVVEHLDAEALRVKYAHLNPGMQRMNLSNRLRNVLRKQAEAASK